MPHRRRAIMGIYAGTITCPRGPHSRSRLQSAALPLTINPGRPAQRYQVSRSRIGPIRKPLAKVLPGDPQQGRSSEIGFAHTKTFGL
jgi:hypothetical protein